MRKRSTVNENRANAPNIEKYTIYIQLDTLVDPFPPKYFPQNTPQVFILYSKIFLSILHYELEWPKG